MTSEKMKSPALVIILSLITCGIYYMYWLVVTHNDIRELIGDEEGFSGGMVLLLTIVTCGIYGYYWWYVTAKKMNVINEKAGLPVNDNAVLYLVLAIFRLEIVNIAILQSELNKVWSKGIAEF
ncbi:protein of unknown function [Pilibacter termitis]|uniref:DUF4234 domain-containing protein n=1 Tax=Pilibacter termitis TaxID=263852 RepID=A0A1T4LER1_9ENTE|nr:DUF4234 domain-containing protein [Pilibacter termitis]SJZ52964.1 protein of unknown function [Pilibacter termitis]